jgi:hydrogenase-4 component B
MFTTTILLVLLPMALGGAAYLEKKHAWPIAAAAAAAEMALALRLLSLRGQTMELRGVCGLGLNFSGTGLQAWLCILAGFLWLASTLFSGKFLEKDEKNPRFYLFLLLTEGAIMGVFLSADLFTTLVFFEMMSFASWPLVLHRGTPDAVKAANSYLAYAVIGGMVSLMGLFLLYTTLGTLRYDQLTAAAAAYEGSSDLIFLAGCLALVTFAAKVCMFPLHTWLPGSYAQAPSPATALLSGIITKAGVFGIFGLTAKLFYGSYLWGNLILHLGIITALVGGFQALCSTNLKKTIAYSSMSQIGFILVGTGMTDLLGEENTMAVWGSVLHLTNHSLIKLVLLLSAGVVVYHAGTLDFDALQGFGRGKPALAFAFAMPALGVMGFPGWNGYISKTLIHESMVEYMEELKLLNQPTGHYKALEWLFLIAGGMTAAYMTKLFVLLFVEKNRKRSIQDQYDGLNGHYASPLWTAVLCASAVLTFLLGALPYFTQNKIAGLAQDFFAEPEALSVRYFSLGNLKGALISLTIGAVLYVVFVRGVVLTNKGYRNPWPAAWDLEKAVYVPLLTKVLPFAGGLCARLAASIFEWCVALVNKVLFFNYDRYVHPEENNYFARYKSDDPGVRGFRAQIAYALALFSAGFVCIVVYLLLRNFVLV